MDLCDLHGLESSLLSHILSSIGVGFCGADFNAERVNLFLAKNLIETRNAKNILNLERDQRK